MTVSFDTEKNYPIVWTKGFSAPPRSTKQDESLRSADKEAETNHKMSN